MRCIRCNKLMDMYTWGDKRKYSCGDCGIMCWDGSTSTMATQVVFDMRKKCHAVFDKWWKSQGYSRSKGYRKLSKLLKIPKNKCHIGMFQEEECELLLTKLDV